MFLNGSTLMLQVTIQQHDGTLELANTLLQKIIANITRDFFVKHSDDEAREARYLHRTWRKPDGGFYVGIDPPEGAKAEGIVSTNFELDSNTNYLSTILVLVLSVDVQCITDVSLIMHTMANNADCIRSYNGTKRRRF
jgi:hypothetical protein